MERRNFISLFIVVMLGLLSFESNAVTPELWEGESVILTAKLPDLCISGYDNVHITKREWKVVGGGYYLALEEADAINKRKVTLKKIFPGEKTVCYTVTYYCSKWFAGSESKTREYTHTCYFYIKCRTVDVILYPTSKTLKIGQSIDLQYVLNPSESTPAAVVWFSSSNTKVATVDLKGKVTAVGVGTATITAKTNFGTTATCKVTVNPVKATAISLNKSDLSLPVGGTQNLTATVTPSNTTNKSVTWTSNNSAVATVDKNGKVTAKSAGKARITAKTSDGSNLTAYCNVTVGILANSVSFKDVQLKKNIGETFAMSPIFTPSNVTNKTLKWTSSNLEVASVDSVGNVTTHQVGTVKIIAKTTDGTNLSASCDLTIINPISSIELSETKLNMQVNEFEIISAAIYPTDATEQSLKWEVSDSAVLRVENGIVIALKEGVSKIRVSSTDGSEVYAECDVIVGSLVETIELSDIEIVLNMGEFKQIATAISPENAIIKDVIWETSDSSVVTVNDGFILAHGEGIATITVSALDNSGVYAACTVSVNDPSGIEEISSQGTNVYVSDGTIIVNGTREDELCEIFTIEGKKVYSGTNKRITLTSNGIYIVKIGNKVYKVVL